MRMNQDLDRIRSHIYEQLFGNAPSKECHCLSYRARAHQSWTFPGEQRHAQTAEVLDAMQNAMQ